jgi:CRISPR-associated protein Csb2
MCAYFCLSFSFPVGVFHGQNHDRNPEWPPSPLRVFQSLVAAACRRAGGTLPEDARKALEWLERQPPPEIAAPLAKAGAGYRLSVPNNAMDVVAGAWVKGNYTNQGDANPATHRTMKDVRPVFVWEQELHYLWALEPPENPTSMEYLQTLCSIAPSVVALGWGIDLALCRGAILSPAQSQALPGQRYLPVGPAGDSGLRVPIGNTLQDVLYRHNRFLKRIAPGAGLVPPPPLTVYSRVDYRPAGDLPRRAIAAFALLRPDATGYRVFEVSRRGLSVAAMMRFATRSTAEKCGWSRVRVNQFILGHGEAMGDDQHRAVGPLRFAYVPLPTLEARGAGRARVVAGIRRVLLTCYAAGGEQALNWARKALPGQLLIEDGTGEQVAVLFPIPATEKVVRCYTQPASTWATVTPVILPGFDDPKHYRRRLKKGPPAEQQRALLTRLDERIDGLIRKAIVQAGFPAMLARTATIKWQKTGFLPGNEPAENYRVPEHLKAFPRFHVKIQWRDDKGNEIFVGGPVCIGGGRYYGLGLFAAM